MVRDFGLSSFDCMDFSSSWLAAGHVAGIILEHGGEFGVAAPDELRIKIAVAAFIGDLDRRFVGLAHEGLVFDRGEVLAFGVVAEGGDGFAFGGFGRHRKEINR